MVAGVGCSISKLEFAVTMSNMKVQSIKIPKVLNKIELQEVLQCHSKVVWFEDLEKFKTPGTLTMLATMRDLSRLSQPKVQALGQQMGWFMDIPMPKLDFKSSFSWKHLNVCYSIK